MHLPLVPITELRQYKRFLHDFIIKVRAFFFSMCIYSKLIMITTVSEKNIPSFTPQHVSAALQKHHGAETSQ